MADISVEQLIGSLDETIVSLNEAPSCPYVNAYAVVEVMRKVTLSVLESEKVPAEQKKGVFAFSINMALKMVNDCRADWETIRKDGISDSGIIWVPKSEC